MVTAQVVSCMRCANSWGLGPSGPSLVRGGALLLFPGTGSRERSGREPVPVLPNPNPMDEVHGGKMFWRQLNSRFGYGQIRNLGSYVIFYIVGHES